MTANSPKPLPIFPKSLDSLRIATPCRVEWTDMTQLVAGDERVRFCGQCEKNVYNVVAMSRSEAETLIREKEGNLCLRLHQRTDGTVITADCPVGVQKERLRARLWARVAKATASLGLLLGLMTGKARADASLRDGDKAAVKPADKQGDKPGAKKIPTPPIVVTAGVPSVVEDTPKPKPPKKDDKPAKAQKAAKPNKPGIIMGAEG